MTTEREIRHVPAEAEIMPSVARAHLTLLPSGARPNGVNYKLRDKARFSILKALHDRTLLDRTPTADPVDLGTSAALSREDSADAAQDLALAGLVERVGDSFIRLSAEGTRTIERVLRRPLEATDLYPDVMNFVDAERGTRSIPEVLALLAELVPILSKLRLENDARARLREHMKSVQAELERPAPSRPFVLEELVAIREILEQAAEGDGIVPLAHVTKLIDEEVEP